MKRDYKKYIIRSARSNFCPMSSLRDFFDSMSAASAPLSIRQKFVINCDSIVQTIDRLKNHHNFDMFIDLFCVDHPHKQERFEIIYILRNSNSRDLIAISASLSKNDAENERLCSISDVFEGAIWYERETYDMYGVTFKNLRDKRRILMEDDFQWFPMRKDFPLTGYEEVYYDGGKAKICTRPVQLEQDYRFFDTLTPWSAPNLKNNEE